jgi:hypothetical protein
MRSLFLFLSLVISAQFVTAQDIKVPYYNFQNGVGITSPDSNYSLNIRFRTQNRIVATISDKDLSLNQVDMRVRECRLRLDGYVVTPKLLYSLQFGFSRSDLDFNVSENSRINSAPNVLVDAMVFYKFNNNIIVGLGESPIPSNRERYNSSGDLQFIDRSIVSSTFNMDRDFGVFGNYTNHISELYYAFRGAITTGEGRNSGAPDNGLCYTARLDLLPFGEFTNKGDFYEGDLAREKKPKLGIAGMYNYNDMAWRTSGETGRDLFEKRDIESICADGVFKYKGFAVLGEYIIRNANNPITTNGTAERHVYTGTGENFHISYIFKNNLEIAARYAAVHPSNEIKSIEKETRQYVLGCTQYVKGHRVKFQENIGYQAITGGTNNWNVGFQVELGI